MKPTDKLKATHLYKQATTGPLGYLTSPVAAPLRASSARALTQALTGDEPDFFTIRHPMISATLGLHPIQQRAFAKQLNRLEKTHPEAIRNYSPSVRHRAQRKDLLNRLTGKNKKENKDETD
jgi:hypothetical protein